MGKALEHYEHWSALVHPHVLALAKAVWALTHAPQLCMQAQVSSAIKRMDEGG